MFNSTEDKLISEIKDAFKCAKNFFNSELPFGLANCQKQCLLKDVNDSSDQVLPNKFVAMRYYAFNQDDEGEQFFYRFQQQRRRWWRKFSHDPGKFEFAEIEKENDILTAKILMKVPWGAQIVETITHYRSKPFEGLSFDDENIFSLRNGRKRSFPHLTICETNLDSAVFLYICDAFISKEGKVVLKFHRKLAPFKFGFAANCDTDEEKKSLLEVAELMCLNLRKVGLPSLLPTKVEFIKKKLDYQLNKHNSLGIPYTAVLSKDTLNTGIFGLYSRDTSLQEEVHISKMTSYGELLMKNY